MENITLEEFLIENTNINKEFIRDFFGIQKDEKYNEYKPFTIDLDIVTYWLKSTKGVLKSTLKHTYIKNLDYILLEDNLKQDNDTHGGHNKELILLTSECFKNLCMASRTKNSKLVRSYYIELEKLVDKYKDVIIKTMKKEIKTKNRQIEVLLNDLKNDDLPDGDHVYIFKEKDEFGITYYRIGQTKNLKKRFSTHNSSSVHKKELLFKIKTNDKEYLESCLLTLLDKYRYKNEKDFFKTTISKIEKAIKMCNEAIIEFDCFECDNDNNDKETFNEHLLNYHLHPREKFLFKLDI
jgi:phage anti-repressor protein